jgi:hypothetical protein
MENTMNEPPKRLLRGTRNGVPVVQLEYKDRSGRLTRHWVLDHFSEGDRAQETTINEVKAILAS